MSYKEAKHLCQHHGSGIFKGLVTGTNTLGAVSVQFHVVSDSHDQMRGQLRALCDTLAEYGMPGPRRLATDKPAEDNGFFKTVLPSLQQEQERLTAIGSGWNHM